MNFLKWTLSDFRFFSFLMALFIYAFAGSPTPDNPGLIELAIGVPLVVAVGIPRVFQVFRDAWGQSPLWQKAALLFFVYGLSVSLAVALLFNNTPVYIMRDIFSFLFLLLPLLLFPLFQEQPERCQKLLFAAIVIGFVFSLRLLWPVIFEGAVFSDPGYMANVPTVLIAALLCLGFAGQKLYGAATIKNFIQAIFLVIASVPMLSVMMLTTQRASMGMVFISLVFWFCAALMRKPARALFPLIAGIIIFLLMFPFVHHAYEALTLKTAQVGWNMRFEEIRAVFGTVDGSFMTALLGRGWGAVFSSPAVGGVSVNFTHSLLSGVLLKMGLLGLCALGLYLFFLARLLPGVFWRNPVIGMALLAPFAIDTLLYASYKSLDFGVLLLLIPVMAVQVAKNPRL